MDDLTARLQGLRLSTPFFSTAHLNSDIARSPTESNKKDSAAKAYITATRSVTEPCRMKQTHVKNRMTKGKDQSRISFFDLPRELRDMIYEHSVVTTEVHHLVFK